MIIIEYDNNSDICSAHVNNCDFHFYTPERFWGEYHSIIYRIENKAVKIKIMDDIFTGLNDCIKNKKISKKYKDETKCWIDRHMVVSNFYKK